MSTSAKQIEVERATETGEDLPEGWATTTLGELSTYVTSGSRDWSQYYADRGALFVRTQDINRNRLAPIEEIARVALPRKVEGKRTLIERGDVLITITGANVGKCAHIDHEISEAYVSQSVALVRLAGELRGRFIQRQLVTCMSDDGRTLLQTSAYGVGRPVLSLDNVREIPIRLAPTDEQDRIAIRLDEMLSGVNSASFRLAKIAVILRHFKQAVLAAACSGKLTEDWRKEHPNVEVASRLLSLLGARRKAEYKAALEVARRKGKRKPRLLVPTEVPAIQPEGVELPESWASTNVNFLAHVTKLAGFEYTKHIHLEDQGEIPVVRAQNVQMGRFTTDNLKYISAKVSDYLERSQLHGREILMVFIGAGTGNVCMAPSNSRWHLAPNVAKIDVDGINTRYLLLYLQSPVGFSYTSSWIKATAQPSLSMQTIREIVVYIPPLDEQDEIVRRVEALFKLADAIEKRVAAATIRAERLTQAILAKAFRGELVPTEAELARREGRDYEPASVLLERIKKEREKATAMKPKKKLSH